MNLIMNIISQIKRNILNVKRFSFFIYNHLQSYSNRISLFYLNKLENGYSRLNKRKISIVKMFHRILAIKFTIYDVTIATKYIMFHNSLPYL